MSSLLLMALVLLAIIIGVAYIAAQKGRSPGGGVEEPAFEACKGLFSPAERSFYGVLEQAVAGEFKVFGKVRLGDLIQPAKGMFQSRRTGIRNRINQKHVDFVLCHPDTLAVVGAVELDDASHGRKDRADRDDFVDKALVSAGVPLLRFPARKGYAVAEVQEWLAATFGLKVEPVNAKEIQAASSPEAVGVEAMPEPASASPREETALPAEKVLFADTPSAPDCPACNVPMVKRQAKKGPNAGKWFWACVGYPKCRKVLAVEVG
jgi:hypothetical protein